MVNTQSRTQLLPRSFPHLQIFLFAGRSRGRLVAQFRTTEARVVRDAEHETVVRIQNRCMYGPCEVGFADAEITNALKQSELATVIIYALIES